MRSSKLYRSKSTRSKRFYYLILLIISLLLGLFMWAKRYLKIEEIEINGASEFEVLDLYSNLSSNYLGSSVFALSNLDIKNYVEESFPRFSFVSKEYIFPNKLLIVVQPRSEVYTVSDINGSAFSIDSDGYIFKLADSDAKVDIVYDKAIVVGQSIDDEVMKSAFFYVFDGGEVLINGEEISMMLDNGGKVILPKNVDKQDLPRINETLQKIIQKYTIENRGIEFIDMRFSKPVIKFK